MPASDGSGRYCGLTNDTNKWDKVVVDYKYLYILDYSNYRKKGVCVKECPLNKGDNIDC